MIVNKMFSLNKLPLLCASLIVLNTACTDSFEKCNTNQHEATEEMMSHDNLKTGAFFSQLQRNVVLFKDGTNDDGSYQVSQGLSSDLYSGYIAPTGTWYSGVHNGSYYFITNWIEKTFTSGFSGAMPAWQSIVEIANKQGLPEVSALATVVKVEAMHRVADAYGPIPYCNYGSGSLQNSYDGLDDVYKKFFNELDSAIDILTSFVKGNPSATILSKYDLIYSGNATKWVKFANTLRLRLAMRIVYANPELAKVEAEKSIANSIGVITEADDKAALQHSTNLVYHHPLHEIAYNFNAGEARMSASMDTYMNGYNDPRLPAYFKVAVAGGYHGVRLGISTSVWAKYVGDKISNLNVDESTTKIVWITAAESYFLRAEGALRGWTMGGSAKDLYEKGISVSFEENGVKNASTYIADATSVPIAFTDNAEGSNLNATAPSDITIAWDVNASFEKNLERIITQKWIAIYPDGPEGWAEFRRTGYPKLLPVVTNNSNGTINSTIQVRRIPYPQSEYNNNSTGVQVGITKLGGQDNGGTKLWWDKK
ncbi:RagB/SusD family nutrient uptake outer membrane protein [uncultured Bacteroides sp.]|uniref:RagB/SusD family nutrient uptake outer membrane protein n=1 Tax=uncultured Bacteroides sp. TaxID=162156 RepID=UPI002AAB9A73|nr:RagB/SusD family nutrient uptake outer membrane protein [uncultured Bacteroides sp.]